MLWHSQLGSMRISEISTLNPNLGGLFRDSFWGSGGVKLPRPPCLKLFRIMARQCTHMQFQKIYLLVPRPSQFCRCQIFFAKKSTFSRLLLKEKQGLQTMHSESGFWIVPNWPWIAKMAMTSPFYDMTSTSIFLTLFLFSSLVTGPNFMSISSLILELWQFPFIWIDQKSRDRK